jgi:hypothetical protein
MVLGIDDVPFITFTQHSCCKGERIWVDFPIRIFWNES